MTDEELMVYQIGLKDEARHRFILTTGFNDEGVEAALKEGEYIDCIITLAGFLGRDVETLSLLPLSSVSTSPQATAEDERLCFRRSCRRPGANYWNSSTRRWYCHLCAMLINEYNPGLCVRETANGPQRATAGAVGGVDEGRGEGG